MMKIYNIAAAAAALLLVAGCASAYDDQLEALHERVEKLKAEDQVTREVVLTEIDRLSKDILAQLADMEENVLDNLDQAVARMEDLILENTMQTRKVIRTASQKAGCDIDTWTARLSHLTDKYADVFSQSLAIMQEETRKAIQMGDMIQVQRISNAREKVEWMQNNLSGLIEKTQARISSLDDLEKKYADVNKRLPALMDRKNNMLLLIDQYEKQLQEIITANLENWESKSLGNFSAQLYEMYAQMEEMRGDIIDMTEEIQSRYDSMPDVEGALDEAQTLVDEMLDMESLVDDFDMSTIDDIISELNDAMGYGAALQISTDEVDYTFDYFAVWVEVLIDDCAAMEDDLEEKWNWMDEALSVLEEYSDNIYV